MNIKLVLVDLNPKMVAAWSEVFAQNPEVEVVQGSMLSQRTSAWVTPTNSRASMDGGLDAAVRGYLGRSIQARVRRAVRQSYGELMPVGHATCVETGRTEPSYLISTPTMLSSAEDISETLNVALACGAAFQAVAMQHRADPAGLRSVAMPGLGAGTGRVSPAVCADLMWTAYSLFLEHEFADFAEMREALSHELGDLGPDPAVWLPPRRAVTTPYRQRAVA